MILFIHPTLSQNCVMKTVLVCLGFVREVSLVSNLMSLISLFTSCLLYRLVTNFSVRWGSEG